MKKEPGTGKYERLLERCRGLEPVATAVIMGLGPDGYRTAVEAMLRRLGGN